MLIRVSPLKHEGAENTSIFTRFFSWKKENLLFFNSECLDVLRCCIKMEYSCEVKMLPVFTPVEELSLVFAMNIRVT
jgi:hypothetical protein